jgi:hypothetical protein
MKIVCLFNTGAGLSERHALLGNTPKSQFHIAVGREYAVHAMSIWRSVFYVLIVDEVGRPHWYPMEAFRIADPRLPDNWYFRDFRDAGCYLEAIWGYRDMVVNSDHYDALVDRQPDALRLFWEAISDPT